MSNRATYEIQIKSTADLKAAEASRKAIEEAIKQTKALGGDTAALETRLKAVNAALASQAANAVKASAALREAAQQVNSAGGNGGALAAQAKALEQQHGLRRPGVVGRAAGAAQDMLAGLPGMGGAGRMLGAAGGAAAGVGVFAAGLAKGIQEYAQAEQAVASLDAALAQAGQLNDKTREQYQAMAGELQKLTGVADDEWLGVLARLTQMGSRPETIGMDVDAVKNLAGLLGGDVTQAAQMYSKALQGQFEMFGRLGIKLDEHLPLTQKLTRLQEELAQRGGGQLEARAKTLTGQWQILKHSTGDLFEAFGRGAAQTGVLQSVLYGMSTSAGWLAEKLGGVVPKVEGLENASKKTTDTLAAQEAATRTLAAQEDALAKAATSATEALARQLTALDNNLRRTLELIDATKRQAEAEIDADSTKTPEEKAAAKAVLNAKNEREREDLVIQHTENKRNAILEKGRKREGELGAAGRERAQAEADLAKSRELDATAEEPLSRARDAQSKASARVNELREKLAGKTRDDGTLLPGGEGIKTELEGAEGALAVRNREVVAARNKAEAARKAAGLTGTTADLETRVKSAKEKEAKLRGERDADAPKEAADVAELDAEIEHKRKLRAVHEKTRKTTTWTAHKGVDPSLPDLPPADRPPAPAPRPAQPHELPFVGPPVPPEMKAEQDAKRFKDAKIADLERKIAALEANASRPGATDVSIEANRNAARAYAVQVAALRESANNVAQMSAAMTAATEALRLATADAAARAAAGRR